ncbi:helix-turn-helix domain-containing protein [Pseudomonas aeruginosa]|uniref:helix-turn-helix domain-containing protein n=1 Tax=Pseudomonas aeruginosa TaxID=287 RepID=UPI000A33076C|nr:helix-turn-helix transcriptional regulator [Pseudomonas aeruginosa]OTH17567.1 transcriptional regulator [Pseudomonas aeruginosa]
MTVAQNIRKDREAKGSTPEEAAARCGISLSMLKKYESRANLPTADKIENLASGPGVSADEIIFETDQRSVPAELVALFKEITRLPEQDQAEIRRALKGHLMILHQQHM